MDEHLRTLRRPDRGAAPEHLVAFLRAADRCGQLAGVEETYLDLCRRDPNEATNYLAWRAEVGALSKERLTLAAYCGHAPATRALTEPPPCHSDLAIWVRCLGAGRRIGSGLTEATERLALLLSVDWICDQVHAEEAWRELASALWAHWEFSPEAASEFYLARVAALRAPSEHDIQLCLLVSLLVEPRSHLSDLVSEQIANAALGLELDPASLLAFLRARIAQWALRLDRVESWHAHRVLTEEYEALLLRVS